MGTGFVLGKKLARGRKTRIRYPAMTSGYISYTYSTYAEALRHKKALGHWQQRKAKLFKL